MEFLLGIFLAGLFGFLLFFAMIVITFIAAWKVHAKAGLPGWSGILPYYNYYVRAETCGNVDLFWKSLKFIGLTFGIGILGSIILTATGAISAIAMVGSEAGGALGFIVTILLSAVIVIASIVMMIIAIIQLIKIDAQFVAHFGKSMGFAIGMALLPYIFYPILAWGKATWDDGDYTTVESEIVE